MTVEQESWVAIPDDADLTDVANLFSVCIHGVLISPEGPRHGLVAELHSVLTSQHVSKWLDIAWMVTCRFVLCSPKKIRFLRMACRETVSQDNDQSARTPLQ